MDLGLVRLADVSPEDLRINAELLANEKQGLAYKAPKVVTWFLPIVTHALKGGVRTVFMFAEEFSRDWGTLNVFVLYSHSSVLFDPKPLAVSLRQCFPALKFTVMTHRKGKDHLNDLPDSDIAFCTLWTTAYLLLKFNKTGRKFYLMQDFEPAFYQAGDVYGVIEQTYRFGFSCVANTPGVAERYLRYSDDVVAFLPGVDREVFYADLSKTGPNKPFRLVFYGRPSNARNCFGLGALTLAALKRKLRDQVEIISVGENWKEADYDLEGVVSNWGLLGSLQEVANLYRSADLGLVFMMTPHPSYQPLEYMACGCVVATNMNEANQWFLTPQNALLLEPIPEVAAQRIHDLLRDEVKWRTIRNSGLQAVSGLSWDAAFDVVKARIAGDRRAAPGLR